MRIFVDMDEVIADAYQAHIDIYEKEYGTRFTKAECEGREFWQCVPKAHQKKVRDHADSIGFFRDLKVIANSQEVLRELSKKHEVYIASAAMQFPYSLKEKSDWLDIFFPFIPWQYRILCGHKHILKGDLLIDDRSYNLEGFDGRRLLFTSPHNTQTDKFERVSSWNEIASLLL
ncbi:MAG: 5'(3')-deoxyribonucleotidase [Bacteroidota bacterium]